ncbi:3'-5'-exoribonuclease [Oleoguttula sp. CCFEE 5521]
MQADRRRLNAPAGGTAPPVFASSNTSPPRRKRKPNEHRKIFLQTGIVPSAAGSAYYELPPDPATPASKTSSLKITCTVHGPRPLPRNAAFSPNLLLTTHVKYAPFATKTRRGYVRDGSERDLGLHLETALRGVVIGERWPKSAADVVITVLEGEDDGPAGTSDAGSGWGMLSVLAGCITAASAAIADAGIDCVDLVSGGVAALVHDQSNEVATVLDPAPAEHETRAACLVAHLQSRDEITEMWMKGDAGGDLEELIESAVQSATLARTVLVEAVKDSTEAKVAAMSPAEQPGTNAITKGRQKDAVMTG